jgi:hypothetical protein
LPSLATISRDIRKQRQLAQGIPAVPAPNDHAFLIPQAFTVTSTGQPFLQVDCQLAGRMLLFASQESLDFLSQSPDWFMDGTFSTVPQQFAQLYTVHGLQDGRHVVGMYALLPDKREATYERMLRHLNGLINGAGPTSVMVDFERAAINAISRVYPAAEKKGCLFHLSQSVSRKIQETGNMQVYLQNPVFRENMRMMPALAFVPVQDVQQSFDLLAQHCGPVEQPMLDYFETTYVGEMRRGV